MPYDDSNVEADAEPVVDDTWEVCGEQDVLGNAPGTTFEAVIPEAQARRLIDRGAIRRVGAGGSAADAAEQDTSDEDANDEIGYDAEEGDEYA